MKKKKPIFCQHGRRDGSCPACNQYDQDRAAAAAAAAPVLGPVHVEICRRGSCGWVGQMHGHVGAYLVFFDEPSHQVLQAQDLVHGVQLVGKLLGKNIRRRHAGLIAGAVGFLLEKSR